MCECVCVCGRRHVQSYANIFLIGEIGGRREIMIKPQEHVHYFEKETTSVSNRWKKWIYVLSEYYVRH